MWLSYGTHLLEVGQLSLARRVVQRGLAARQRLLAELPGDAERRRHVANAASYLADVEKDAGDLAAALQGYELVREVYTALVAEDPGSARNRWGLICGYSNTADVLFQQRQLEEARARAEKALELCEALRKDRPDHYTVLQGLGAFHHQLGELHLAAGDPARARAEFETARGQRAALAARDAHDLEAAMALTRTEGELAALLPPADAPRRFEELHARLDALAASRPDHRRLTLLRAELSVREAKTGADACAHLALADAPLASLAARAPELLDARRLLSEVATHRARCAR
ncbi:MAG: hypothetical protein ACOZQL_25365 [Myxococcota bacterium]